MLNTHGLGRDTNFWMGLGGSLDFLGDGILSEPGVLTGSGGKSLIIIYCNTAQPCPVYQIVLFGFSTVKVET